jgi:hypothetical protein
MVRESMVLWLMPGTLSARAALYEGVDARAGDA